MNEWDERMNEQTNEHNGKMFIDSSDIMKKQRTKTIYYLYFFNFNMS